MAGFDEADGLHFNPRTACEPPRELSNKIFPWIEDEIEKVFQTNDIDCNTRITAVSVLRLWAKLRIMGAIDGELTKDRSIDDVMREYEGIFGEKKKSLSALVVELQSRGLINKKVRNLRQSP